MRHLLLLCLLLLLLLPSSSLQQPPPSGSGAGSDLQALIEFKKGILKDGSGLVLRTWTIGGSSSSTSNADLCPGSWHGVTCDSSGSSVVSVVLDGLGLSGEIKFSTLIGMKSLQVLSLAHNNLTGRLVPALGTMASLQRLDLSGNRFYGRVPGKIVELWRLNYLNFSFNGFDGVFPAEVGRLQQLRQLDLRSNGLWGDIRHILSELKYAEHVDLSGNAFFGDLWMPPWNLSRIGDTARYMNFSNNKLNGGFFSNGEMVNFRNLEVLDVSNNMLRGKLPKLDSLPNLRILKVANNQLHGSLREEIFTSSMALREVDLSGNVFTGSIFNINSTSLKVLNLSSNALSGALPTSVGSCIQVDLSANKLSGNLLAIQNWGSHLEVIDLGSNELSGILPNFTSRFPSLRSIKMRNISLSGGLLFESHPSLSTVDLSLNKFNGFIPVGFFTSLNLTNLNLSGNHFTGSIPIQIPHSTESLVISNYPHMESLDLSHNSLSGPIPPDIVYFEKLRLLYLQHNFLSDHIPTEIGKLDNLEFLDLSSNKLSGKIPDIDLPSLEEFNVCYNDLVGAVPSSLRRFPDSSFHPGNALLIYPGPAGSSSSNNPGVIASEEHRHLKSRIRLAIIIACIGAFVLIFFIVLAVYRIRTQEFCGRNSFRGKINGRDLKFGRFSLNLFQNQTNEQLPGSMKLSSDCLSNSGARTIPAQKVVTEQGENDFSDPNVGMTGSELAKGNIPDHFLPNSGFKFSPGSPLASLHEQPVVLSVYSPDRLAGELSFLDNSLVFTAEDLSRAPAEVLGRSSHGTSYKATLDNGHMLTVKWLRVGLVKRKKEFAKEMNKIGTMRHPNIISFRGYYWGPREQERLIVSDYVTGDSLALHLYESTPRRYSKLTFNQRLKITIDVARCLCYLHQDRGLPHGNLKPTNILLSGPELTAQLTDYALHHLMTLSGTAEQMLNLGALGYRAPELANAAKPLPTFKADVYAFGVIIMELLTRRSAGDIISGQTGEVDLTDWVRMCARKGRGSECFDRDIAGLDEAPRAMDELLAVSLRCTLPVNERPHIASIFEDLCSICS